MKNMITSLFKKTARRIAKTKVVVYRCNLFKYSCYMSSIFAGYGFVTFMDSNAAQMASSNPNPTIDGTMKQ